MNKLLTFIAITSASLSTAVFATTGGSNAPYGGASNQTASGQYVDCKLEDGTTKVIPIRACDKLGGKKIY